MLLRALTIVSLVCVCVCGGVTGVSLLGELGPICHLDLLRDRKSICHEPFGACYL